MEADSPEIWAGKHRIPSRSSQKGEQNLSLRFGELPPH
jgi:hypothetical protein